MTPRPAPRLPRRLLDTLAGIPAGRHLTGDDRRKAVTAVGTAYYDHGLTINAVAALTPRSWSGVRLLLREANVPIRPAGAPRRTHTERKTP